MKILNVNNVLDPVYGGGTAERTLQLSRAMASRGEECTILTLNIGMGNSLQNRTGNVRVVRLPCCVERYFLPSPSWSVISDLVSWADVVQLMNHWTILNGMVFRYLRNFKKPYVVCPAGAIPIFGRSRKLKNIYDFILGKKIIWNSRKVISISSKEIIDLQKYGVLPEKIALVPNGVDVAEYTARDDAGFRRKYGIPDVPFLLFMGRLTSIKGPDLLLDSFIRMAGEGRFPHHLVLAGPDAGMLPYLRQQSINAGIEDKVHFIGYIGDIDKSHALHAAHLLVIPSRQEAMSIVVLEAGAAGLPVLMTNQCGFDDITRIIGGVVTDATCEGIYKGLIEMLDNRGNISKMGENLRNYVFEQFTWDNAARLYLELFNEILNDEI